MIRKHLSAAFFVSCIRFMFIDGSIAASITKTERTSRSGIGKTSVTTVCGGQYDGNCGPWTVAGSPYIVTCNMPPDCSGFATKTRRHKEGL